MSPASSRGTTPHWRRRSAASPSIVNRDMPFSLPRLRPMRLGVALFQPLAVSEGGPTFRPAFLGMARNRDAGSISVHLNTLTSTGPLLMNEVRSHERGSFLRTHPVISQIEGIVSRVTARRCGEPNQRLTEGDSSGAGRGGVSPAFIEFDVVEDDFRHGAPATLVVHRHG